MYTYYKKIQKEEHLLFAEEIYEMLSPMLENFIEPRAIHSIIKNYCKNHNIEIEEVYYQTSKGLKKVYDVNIATKALREYYLSKH